MTARKYDISQAIDVTDYEFRGNQQGAAEAIGAKKILVTEDIRRLPQYLINQIHAAGYQYSKIGRTTYVKNVFALY